MEAGSPSCHRRQRLEPAGQIPGVGEAQVAEGRRSQAGGVALGADDDDGLVVAADLRQGVAPTQVEAPLEHVALHDEPEAELPFGGSLGCRPDVDHQGAVGTERLELFWLDPADPRPCGRKEVVCAADRHRAAECAPAARAVRGCSASAQPSAAHSTARNTSWSPHTS